MTALSSRTFLGAGGSVVVACSVVFVIVVTAVACLWSLMILCS